MKRTVRLLKFKAKFLAYFALVCVLLYVVAGRIILSHLTDQREELQQFLTDQLGVVVEIGQLDSKWSAFDPIIEVRGITINGASQAHIKTAAIRFAFLASIQAQTPKIKEIKLDNVNLAVDQMADGMWLIAGLDPRDIEPTDQPTNTISIEDVLDGTNLKLVDAYVRVNSPNEDERIWRLPSASLSYVDDKIYAQGNLIRPDGLQPLLRFVYNSGQLGVSPRLSGELFIEARSSSFLDRLVRTYEFQGLSIQELDASGRAWISLSGLTPESIYADVQLNRLDWKIDETSLPPIIQSNLRVAWHGNENGHRVDLYGLDFNWRGEACSVPGATVEKGISGWQVAVSSLPLACASDLMVSLGFLDEGLNTRLEESDPKGTLNNVWLTIGSADSETGFLLAAELEDVALDGYQGAPALSGVNGYLTTTEKSGYIEFQSKQFGLFFPDLYRKGWVSSDAHGKVTWSDQGRDFVVQSDGLSLALFDNAEVFGDFILRLNDSEHEDYLALVLGLRRVDAPDVAAFVPDAIIDEELYSWLESSLKSGEVRDGMYLGYGSIESNSPDNSFSSSLAVQTQDLSLQFDPEWPELEQLNVGIVLHEDRLEIEGQNAVIAGTKVRDLNVLLPGSLSEKPGSELQVQAQFDILDDDYTYWLAQSPIAENTRAVSDALAFTGQSDLELALRVGLGETFYTEHRVDLKPLGVRVEHKQSHLFATDLKGLIRVDSEAGISSENISINFQDHPASLALSTNPLRDATLARLDGRFKLDALNFPDATWSYGLSGGSAFTAVLEIPNEPELDTNLRVTSDLEGISSSWPAPLAKGADSINPLEVSIDFKTRQTDIEFQMNGAFLPQTEGEILFIGEQLEFGRIVLSSQTSDSSLEQYAYAGEGIGVYAQLSEFELEPWVDYLNQNLPRGSDSASKSPFGEILVQSSQVDAYGQSIADVKARVLPGTQTSQIKLESDNARGEVIIPQDTSPLQVKLDRLVLSPVVPTESDVVDGESHSEATTLDPRDIESMSFSIKELIRGEQNLGAWSFWTDADEFGVVFRDLKGRINGSELDGQLTWQFDDGQSHTILTLDAEGENIEPVMAFIGQDSPLVSERYTADIAIVWSDMPQNFDLARASGSANLFFEDGTVRTDNNATGILRLFGLFSLDAIARRLRLDFSDVYKSGIAYDELSIDAVMDQGQLTFVSPMTIKGPSSNYVLRGGVDMGAQTLDLEMLVAIPVSSNVPIAGLMLGNPALGGAVWLVDKILGEPLSKLSTLGYSVTGTWDNPELKLDQAINAK